MDHHIDTQGIIASAIVKSRSIELVVDTRQIVFAKRVGCFGIRVPLVTMCWHKIKNLRTQTTNKSNYRRGDKNEENECVQYPS